MDLMMCAIAISLALAFLVLGVIFGHLKKKFIETKVTKNITDKGTGKLLCFRCMFTDSEWRATECGYIDSMENRKGYYPVIRFTVDGVEFTERIELPESTLSKEDTGSDFNICYTDKPYFISPPYNGDKGKKYRVLLDTSDYWNKYNKYIKKQGNSFGHASKIMYGLAIVIIILIFLI